MSSRILIVGLMTDMKVLGSHSTKTDGCMGVVFHSIAREYPRVKGTQVCVLVRRPDRVCNGVAHVEQ